MVNSATRGHPPAMGRRMESTTVYFQPGTLARLMALSERTDVPMAVMIRKAVGEYLKEHDPAGESPSEMAPIACPS